MADLDTIFQWIVRFFQGMDAPGFCSVKQKESNICH